jgi:hypothetical protein
MRLEAPLWPELQTPSLEKLTVGASRGSQQAAWLLEQVEVTDEAAGGCVGGEVGQTSERRKVC